MRKIVVSPYKLGSAGARNLANKLTELTGRKVWRVKPTYVPRRDEVVIRWGQAGTLWLESHDLNTNTSIASNKLASYKAFKEHNVTHPEWTVDKAVAKGWLDEGITVLARTLLSSSEGNGITVVEPGGVLPNAKVFTKYTKKKSEWRVHVLNGKVIEVVQKKKKAGQELKCSKIRSYRNGWVFCRQEINIPEKVKQVGIDAVKAVKVDFGAVDVIYNEHYDTAYALEVNTAPGIEGTTINTYAKNIIEYVRGLK